MEAGAVQGMSGVARKVECSNRFPLKGLYGLLQGLCAGCIVVMQGLG